MIFDVEEVDSYHPYYFVRVAATRKHGEQPAYQRIFRLEATLLVELGRWQFNAIGDAICFIFHICNQESIPRDKAKKYLFRWADRKEAYLNKTLLGES
jgi:hypothetical protein